MKKIAIDLWEIELFIVLAAQKFWDRMRKFINTCCKILSERGFEFER